MKENQTLFSLDNGIKVKNRTFVQWLVLVVALWSFLMKPVSGLPGPLGYLKYLPDGILLALLLLSLRYKKLTFRREILPILLVVVGFFLYCLVVYLVQFQKIAYFLWGFRNNFRFYLAFFTFITYLERDDVLTWFKVADILFWINAVLSAFQFFVMGISGDYLGGIFGILGSSNGFTLGLLSIVVGKTLIEAFDGNELFWKSMLKCVVSIVVAAMAELKFYFFVFALLMIGASILTHFSVRKIVFLLLGAIVIMIGAMVLVQWFGFNGFLSLDRLWEYATKDSYSSEGDINRLSSVTALSERVLTNPVQRIFGLGLGNCDTSAFAICNTPFYRNYGYLHYIWFTIAMIFLETGYVGLIIYSGFFVVCLLRASGHLRTQTDDLIYSKLSILIAGLCLIVMVYNASLRTEPGYMFYFVLAAPYICGRGRKLAQEE